MRRIAWLVMVAMLGVAGGSATTWADDPVTPEATTDTAAPAPIAPEAAPAPAATPAPETPAATPAPAAPTPAPASVSASAPAPAAPVPATPDLKPIVIKFSGEVVQVSKQDAEHPALTIRDRYGVTKEMTSDAASAESLKTGDQVTVEYTYDVATGKRQVQNVSVTQAAAAPAATQ